METTLKTINSFISDEEGAVAVEYGLMVAGVSVGIISSVMAIGDSLTSTFEAVSEAMSPNSNFSPAPSTPPAGVQSG